MFLSCKTLLSQSLLASGHLYWVLPMGEKYALMDEVPLLRPLRSSHLVMILLEVVQLLLEAI